MYVYAQKLVAAAAVLGISITVVACSDEPETVDQATSTTTGQVPVETQAAPVAELPSAEELNGVIQRAADPNLPIEERALTVQGGQTVPELFDVMTSPDAEPTLINDVTFVHEDGHWKLSQQWACNLVSSALPPDQVPAMCVANAPVAPAPADAPAPEAPAPAPGI